MKFTPKYKTFKELQAAYASSEISADNPLLIDPDAVYLFGDKEEALFSRNDLTTLLAEALALLNIPCEVL